MIRVVFRASLSNYFATLPVWRPTQAGARVRLNAQGLGFPQFPHEPQKET